MKRKEVFTCKLFLGKEWAETTRMPSGSWKNTRKNSEEITEPRRNWSSMFESQAINRTRKATAKCTKMARDFLLTRKRERKKKRVAFEGRNFTDKNSLTPELRTDPSCFRHAGLTALATTHLSSTNNITRLKWNRFPVTKEHVFLFLRGLWGHESPALLPGHHTAPIVPGHPCSHSESTGEKLWDAASGVLTSPHRQDYSPGK